MRQNVMLLLPLMLVPSCSEIASDAGQLKGHIPVCKVTLVRVPMGPQEIGRGQQFDKVDFSSSQWDAR